MTMSRAARNYIACAAGGLCLASFSTYLILFFHYFSSHPAEPDLSRGLVYSLNNHGSYVYLSNGEATGLGLLGIAFVVGFLTGIVAVPKESILPLRGTPRWLTYVSATYRTDLANSSVPMKVIFMGSAVSWWLIFSLVGDPITSFAVSCGFILHLG